MVLPKYLIPTVTEFAPYATLRRGYRLWLKANGLLADYKEFCRLAQLISYNTVINDTTIHLLDSNGMLGLLRQYSITVESARHMTYEGFSLFLLELDSTLSITLKEYLFICKFLKDNGDAEMVITACLSSNKSVENLKIQAEHKYNGRRSLHTTPTNDGYILWHNTPSLAKGMAALNRMYDSLSSNDPLKEFLSVNCGHLLKPLLGNTGIPMNYAKPEVLKKLSNTVKLNAVYTADQFLNNWKKVGIYVFFLEGENNVTQCGSSIRFGSRMRTYYIDAANNKSFFKNYSISDFYWTPVKTIPHYIELFKANNSMSPLQEEILLAFMQQEIRSLEQSYSSFAKPDNYTGKLVNTWHNDWVKESVLSNSTNKLVSWTTEDGTVHTRNSIMAAEEHLNTTAVTLKKYAKSKDKKFMSKEYGPVVIRIDGINLTEELTGLKRIREGTELNTKVDMSNLLIDHYYLYDQNMEQLPYGPYKTMKDTNMAMGLSPNHLSIKHWCNYMHLIKATGLNMSVYVVKRHENYLVPTRPESTGIPIIVTILDTGEVTEVSSVRTALKMINPKLKDGTYTIKKMLLGTPFRGIDGKEYICQYKNSEDKTKAYKRLNPRV